MRQIQIGNIKIGAGAPLVLIAGPCVIESERSTFKHAERLVDIAGRVGIPLVFKSSYDKANRSSINSYRGPGLKRGLAILKKVKRSFNVPILSDVHCKHDVASAKEVLDVIQIPAFLSRQTDLVVAIAKSGCAVNIKRGQFMAPWDVGNVIEKIERAGNKRILLTDRGSSFGYNNLVSDLRALSIMRETGYPVIYDASHSVQLPGGRGFASGGERKFIPGLARAAVAMGCDGLFIEVHVNPDKAPCDGPNMLRLSELEDLLLQAKEISRIVGNA